VQVFWDSRRGQVDQSSILCAEPSPRSDIEAKIEAIVNDFEKAQEPDGYLNCWYLGREPEKRWSNLRDNHELYNAATCWKAPSRITKPPASSPLARCDGTLCQAYPPDLRHRTGAEARLLRPPEIEIALIKLYRLTSKKKHLDLATYSSMSVGVAAALLRCRARGARSEGLGVAALHRGLGIRAEPQAGARAGQGGVGRAVRHVHVHRGWRTFRPNLSAAFKKACDAVARRDGPDVCDGRPSPSAHNEGFTHDFDLPSEQAYAKPVPRWR